MNSERLRRAKRTYIRLAAHLAEQAKEKDELVLSLREIEQILGEALPTNASYPFWWNNEGLTAHSRSWLSSGWRVQEMNPRSRRVRFVRIAR